MAWEHTMNNFIFSKGKSVLIWGKERRFTNACEGSVGLKDYKFSDVGMKLTPPDLKDVELIPEDDENDDVFRWLALQNDGIFVIFQVFQNNAVLSTCTVSQKLTRHPSTSAIRQAIWKVVKIEIICKVNYLNWYNLKNKII